MYHKPEWGLDGQVSEWSVEKEQENLKWLHPRQPSWVTFTALVKPAINGDEMHATLHLYKLPHIPSRV